MSGASESSFHDTALSPFGPFLNELRRRIAARKRRRSRLPGLRPASVLIPLVPKNQSLHVTFMQRTEDGRTHSGQIAFPGGAREPQDADKVATALREAHEEVNIQPDAVSPLGLLNDYASISRYLVTPVVGAVREAPDYAPEPQETQDIFEVPLPWLLRRENERRMPDVPYLGKLYTLYEYRWEQRVIWGLTGRILHDFLTLAREVNHAEKTFDVS